MLLVSVVVAPAALAATPTVSSFSPTSGPVGTTVSISGTGFLGANKVEFNGTMADFTINSDTSITATVPSGATTGPISVCNPPDGCGNSASNFTVTAPSPPTISAFNPTSGPVGTSVVITGSNFTGATAVRFNGVSATFTVNSSSQITATVPSGATDGPITVTTAAGTATSSTSFDVTASNPPTITSFSPTSGPVGTSVVITGTNLTGATSVRFGGTAATFTVNSSTQITATVPTGADTGAITVTTPGGTATSSTAFVVTTSPPTITSFSPTAGPVGTTVVITGTNFTGATSVKFDGKNATFTVDSPTKITAIVPNGASTGKITVTTPSGTATSAQDFVVTTGAPVITSFAPTSGPVGTTVVITGQDFLGTVTVKFDGKNAAFTVNSDTQITATVPAGATTGKITVTNTEGTGTSATDFVVTTTPTITSFTPTSGPVGTSVTITGTGFTGTSSVRFNGVTATFTVNSDTRITATVPSGATTGKITVTNASGTAISSTDFTVTAAVPTITALSPTFGRVGTTVTITGTNFTGVSDVRFNGVSASFTVVSATQITAAVPSGATTGKVTVTTTNGTATSGDNFTVTAVHQRSISLLLRRHLVAKGFVTVADGFTACIANVAVKIQRRRGGVWRTVKLTATDGSGFYRTRIADRVGRYRARAVRIATPENLCTRATSRVRRHLHALA